ncbi:MAG: PfkB family carbohydrate kinase [Candidatus Eisenbacteria bacterium]
MSLLVVGSVALDSVETPAGKMDSALGGSASYFSLAAVRYCPVHLVAVVGSDFPGEDRELLASEGVDLTGLKTAEGPTFRWGGVYHEDMNHRDTLFTELGVFESFHPELPEAYRELPFVLLANIDPELQLEVLEQTRSPRLVALDTMNFWISSKLDALHRVLEKVHLFFLNDEEAKQLTGKTNVLSAARDILRMGPRMVVIKRGEHGALTLTEHGWFSLTAFPVESLQDPTGAGDSFAGGMLGYLASRGGCLDDGELRRAVAHGTAVASHTVEKFGVDGLLDLDRAKIDARVREVWNLSRFELEEGA